MKFSRLLGIPLLIALIMTFNSGCAPAPKATAPEKKATVKADTSWKFHDIVGVDFVQAYVKIPRPKDVLLIDSRPTRKKYNPGYIPTAVNIPDSQFNKYADNLPENKNALLIFYCQGPT